MMHWRRLKLLIPFLALFVLLLVSFLKGRKIDSEEKLQSSVKEAEVKN